MSTNPTTDTAPGRAPTSNLPPMSQRSLFNPALDAAARKVAEADKAKAEADRQLAEARARDAALSTRFDAEVANWHPVAIFIKGTNYVRDGDGKGPNYEPTFGCVVPGCGGNGKEAHGYRYCQNHGAEFLKDRRLAEAAQRSNPARFKKKMDAMEADCRMVFAKYLVNPYKDKVLELTRANATLEAEVNDLSNALDAQKVEIEHWKKMYESHRAKRTATTVDDDETDTVDRSDPAPAEEAPDVQRRSAPPPVPARQPDDSTVPGAKRAHIGNSPHTVTLGQQYNAMTEAQKDATLASLTSEMEGVTVSMP